MYDIKNNGVLPFLDAGVSLTDEDFSPSVYVKNFAVSLPLNARSCHPPSQKMASFYTFFNGALENLISFNIEIQYLKEIALHRGY